MNKRILIVLSVLLLSFGVFAQAPNKMSYQAVVRNSSNQLVTNQSVGIKISILQGTSSGSALYVETQAPTTNSNGMFTIQIGSGSVVSGSLSSIDWSNGSYYIKTEIDPAGGTSYSITGTSQILSVPFALHANVADSLKGGIQEKEPAFKASVASGISATDTTKWNQQQKLSISNDTIYLSNGGNVKLPAASSLPSQSGNSGKYLTTNGTTASWDNISSGIQAFGYVYQLSTIADATVIGGADFPFSNNGPLSGISHTAGITTITVPANGTYKIDYNVSITAGVGAAIAIAINGTVDASTIRTFLVATGNLSGSAILTLAAGDVITIRNNSAIPVTTDLAPGVSTQLSIMLIK